ncbi:hypothetical protein H5T51_06160, partial [Candidatus Bathyarchaeota archaeon]|nr:hypothetical protein [Candidatus Bathyarchaeota archaeon]
MIYCKINYTPDYFTLKISYEHPVEIVNGSHIFLYDLNISPYLTPWSRKSTAFFTIRMEVPYANLSIYTTGANGVWHPVNYTIVKEDTVDIISFQIVSEYAKPLHGDITVKFTVTENLNQQSKYFWVLATIIVFAGALATYGLIRSKKYGEKGQKMKIKQLSMTFALLLIPWVSAISCSTPWQTELFTFKFAGN